MASLRDLDIPGEIIYNIVMDVYDIVFDTNVIYSGLYSAKGKSYNLLSLIGLDKFRLHVSVPLVLEYEEVLKAKHEELGLTFSDIEDFIDYVCASSECHQLHFSWRPCLNDPDDEMILELAVGSNCDFIVTHDMRHFKGIHGFHARAITPAGFLKLIGGQP